jgi:beta-xylosidase
MKKFRRALVTFLSLSPFVQTQAQDAIIDHLPATGSASVVQKHMEQAKNPIIFADVPDMCIIRVDDTYYMSSTTMHMSPGVPVMRSKDLVNWTTVSYAYDILDDTESLNLDNGNNSYGRGSWASSLRYHNGIFYVSTFSGTTGKTYIYTTRDIEKGPWKKISFAPSLHDHSLYFAEDGRTFMVYGNGRIMIAELADDLSGIKKGTTPRVLIGNASAPAGNNIGLQAEGSQLFRVNGKFYLFNICWPRGGMRTVTIHRADSLEGPWEGRVALQDQGVAQGGLISTPEGNWYAYLFRDYGAVGRIPYWVPVTWENDWPVLGRGGKVPEQLNLPASKGLNPGIVESDDFKRKKGEPLLPLAWQWNHNPDNKNWSLTIRPGFLRLTTGRTDSSISQARNTLTQRTFGPQSSGATAIDVSKMKDGDCAGLLLLQKKYGWVGVKMENGEKNIVMVSAESGSPVEMQRLPLKGKMIHLRADCNFTNLKDKANFYYSLDGKSWVKIGGTLKMSYSMPHFMGYRFGLFNYATLSAGGYADFDYFRIGNSL